MPIASLRRFRTPALFVILAVALVYRCWGLGWGLHGADVSTRPHPDEWTAYWVFQWFSQERLNPCPRPGSACFFDWGSGFLYLEYALHQLFLPVLAPVASAVGGSHADPTFVRSVLAGRVTSALISTATVAAVYALGRMAYDDVTGILAAAIMALCALPVEVSHFATPDSTSSFLVAVALALAVTLPRAPTLQRHAAAGVVLGTAVGTEYHLVLLAVPLGIAWLYTAGRNLRTVGLLAACAVAAYTVTNPYAIVQAGAFAEAIQHTLRIRTVDSRAQYGDRWARYGPAWQYIVRYALGYGTGFLFTFWMVVGVAGGIWRRRREDVILLAWILPYGLLVTLSTAKFMRYSLPLLPCLAVLAAGVTTSAWRARARLRPALAALIMLALLYTATYDAAYDGLFAVSDPRAVATAWVQHHAAPGTNLAFEQLPNGVVNLPYFLGERGYHPCIAQFVPGRLSHAARYVVVDDYSLEEHPLVADAAVRRFRQFLKSGAFRDVLRVRYVPTFLGMTFPIDSSPHDWRYPDHVVTVYRYTGTLTSTAPYCFTSVRRAVASLYVPPKASNS